MESCAHLKQLVDCIENVKNLTNDLCTECKNLVECGSLTPTNSAYDDTGAMIFIVVIICVFAVGIALLIAAQMSYRPEGESQVRSYLKQRSFLRDVALIQHYEKKKRRSVTSRSSGFANTALKDDFREDNRQQHKCVHSEACTQLVRQVSLPAKILPDMLPHQRLEVDEAQFTTFIRRANSLFSMTIENELL